MASSAENSELSYIFERMIRNRDMSLFLPFIQGLSESSTPRNTNNPDQESSNPDQESSNNEDSNRQRVILVNPSTQRMIIVEGVSSLETLFQEFESATKKGQPRASKESIEAMKIVEIEESDDRGECVVCLEEFEVGGVVREMPCEHRFHGGCIEKWLGIHGSCPVCRYQMPVDEKDEGKKTDEEEEEEGGGERRRVGGEVWVSFSINRRSRNHDQNQATSGGDSNDSSSSPSDGDAFEN